MDIAFGTLIFIFLLVIPNLIFRRFYFTGAFSYEYHKDTPFLSFISSVIPGFLLHVSFLYLIIVFHISSNQSIKDLATLFNSPYLFFFKNSHFSSDFRSILVMLFHYNLFLWLYVIVVASIARNIIMLLKWDRKFKLLRFKNKWHYIFSGQVLDFPFIFGRSKDISFIHLDILVNTGSDNVLYSGLYYNYEISPVFPFPLENVQISLVSRRFVTNPRDSEAEDYGIPGDFILIPASTILNLNVSYYKLKKT